MPLRLLLVDAERDTDPAGPLPLPPLAALEKRRPPPPPPVAEAVPERAFLDVVAKKASGSSSARRGGRARRGVGVSRRGTSEGVGRE